MAYVYRVTLDNVNILYTVDMYISVYGIVNRYIIWVRIRLYTFVKYKLKNNNNNIFFLFNVYVYTKYVY